VTIRRTLPLLLATALFATGCGLPPIRNPLAPPASRPLAANPAPAPTPELPLAAP